MKILLIQDGYEKKIAQLNGLRFDFSFNVTSYRNSKIYYFFFLLFFLFLLFSRKKHIRVFFSTQEKCEFLLVTTILKNIFGKIDFYRIKINDREKAFRYRTFTEKVFPRRIDLIFRVLPGLVSSIVNDIGQNSWIVENEHTSLDLRKVAKPDYGLMGLHRVIILSEPLRSKSFQDLTKLNNRICSLVYHLVSVNPKLDDHIFIKEHPKEKCMTLEGFSYRTLDKNSNIFDYIDSSDLIIGTFGSVIDIAPSICMTYSVLDLEEVSDRYIIERVLASGARLYEHNNNS